jgi:hypothetical protein
MPISPQAARAELARRELARRGINPTQQPAPAPDKSFMRNAAEMVVDSPFIPIVAGVGAGLASAPLGPGAIGMAGLAGAGAEGYRQMLARSMGLPVPQTSMDAAKQIGIQGASQAAGEAGGQLIGGRTQNSPGDAGDKGRGRNLVAGR